MRNIPAISLTGPLMDGFDTASEALKAAASGTHDFTEDAEEVLASATTEIAKLTESLRTHAVDAAKDAASYAKHEVEAHPLASLATALTAVIAVVGLVALTRRSKSSAQ